MEGRTLPLKASDDSTGRTPDISGSDVMNCDKLSGDESQRPDDTDVSTDNADQDLNRRKTQREEIHKQDCTQTEDTLNQPLPTRDLSSQPSHRSPSLFHRLPGEIRNQIYSLLAPSVSGVVMYVCSRREHGSQTPAADDIDDTPEAAYDSFLQLTPYPFPHADGTVICAAHPEIASEFGRFVLMEKGAVTNFLSSLRVITCTESTQRLERLWPTRTFPAPLALISHVNRFILEQSPFPVSFVGNKETLSSRIHIHNAITHAVGGDAEARPERIIWKPPFYSIQALRPHLIENLLRVCGQFPKVPNVEIFGLFEAQDYCWTLIAHLLVEGQTCRRDVRLCKSFYESHPVRLDVPMAISMAADRAMFEYGQDGNWNLLETGRPVSNQVTALPEWWVTDTALANRATTTGSS